MRCCFVSCITLALTAAALSLACLGPLPLMEMHPEVIAFSPADGSVNLAINTSIKATYNRQMDPDALNNNSVILSNTSTSGLVNLYIGLSPTSQFEVIATPVSFLDYNTTYVVIIKPGMRSAIGLLSYETYTSRFTTYP
jgi:hypothetical protein